MHQFVIKLKKFIWGPYLKTSVQDFSKEKHCSQVLRFYAVVTSKIKEVSCIDFSLNLKNVILGPFSAAFDPKTSKEHFLHKTII